MQAEIIDYVYSRICPKEDVNLIAPAVEYKRARWAQGQFAKEKIIEKACMIDRRGGRFLTGLIPRIDKYCRLKGIPFDFELPEKILATKTAALPGITFRPDQHGMFKAVEDYQRGIIKSPTGSGKTVLAGALCSMFDQINVLFLCHTIDLLTQTYDEFTRWGLAEVSMLGGGVDKNAFHWQQGRSRQIVVSTIQTFSDFDLMSHPDYFDMIIIDEAHHLIKDESQYAQLLNQCLAPIRIGLTATPPKETDGKELLVLEGYLGPIIGEFTMDEAIKAGVIARPLINLIAVPYCDEIADLRIPDDPAKPDGLTHPAGYRDFYQKGIIENRARNRLVLVEADKTIQTGGSVLILIATVTDHGHILAEMGKDIFDLDLPFVYGDTSKELRKETMQALEHKEILGVIANVVWKEGVNIRTLDHVINAAGQAKERATLQRIGRGQRATDTKKFVKITDFLDPYKHLAYHCVLRMTTYAQEGWLVYGR
jgi:superfamily II DNA or RNA helicase